MILYQSQKRFLCNSRWRPVAILDLWISYMPVGNYKLVLIRIMICPWSIVQPIKIEKKNTYRNAKKNDNVHGV